MSTITELQEVKLTAVPLRDGVPISPPPVVQWSITTFGQAGNADLIPDETDPLSIWFCAKAGKLGAFNVRWYVGAFQVSTSITVVSDPSAPNGGSITVGVPQLRSHA